MGYKDCPENRDFFLTFLNPKSSYYLSAVDDIAVYNTQVQSDVLKYRQERPLKLNDLYLKEKELLSKYYPVNFEDRTSTLSAVDDVRTSMDATINIAKANSSQERSTYIRSYLFGKEEVEFNPTELDKFFPHFKSYSRFAADLLRQGGPFSAEVDNLVFNLDKLRNTPFESTELQSGNTSNATKQLYTSENIENITDLRLSDFKIDSSIFTTLAGQQPKIHANVPEGVQVVDGYYFDKEGTYCITIEKHREIQDKLYGIFKNIKKSMSDINTSLQEEKEINQIIVDTIPNIEKVKQDRNLPY